ncbi:MAG TPA: PIN domain-containing protein [Thermoanaerobaculia bacterium]|nr:PIN domain-containing protein [Thermoanaerobaculia bacterium]
MSAEFVDTNVLVYAYDPTRAKKHERARELVSDLWRRGDGTLSVQVLQEFFWTVTRKVPQPLAPAAAIEIVEELAAWNVYAPNADDVVRLAELSARRRIAFRDAMIVHAAISAGSTILWTEDLDAGARFDSLRVRNPFD